MSVEIDTSREKVKERFEYKKPEYVVITNAKRQHMWTDSALHEVHLETNKYRQGDLGLIHPAIRDFYLKHKDGMIQRVMEEGPLAGMDVKSTFRSKPWSLPDMQTISYKYKKGDIPILVYGGNTLVGGGSEVVGYLMTIFKQGEFEKIEAETLNAAKKNIREAYKRNGMELCVSSMSLSKEQTLDRAVEKQWKQLQAFDILMKDSIHEIPIEIAYAKIDPKIVKYERDCAEQALREMRVKTKSKFDDIKLI